jgi:Domain of unknown function (DUF4352)
MRAQFVILLTVLGLGTTSCRDNVQPAEVGTFNMGERAQIGPLIYTVFDSQWAISLGEQPTPRIPTNRFFILNLSVVNSGSQASSVPTFTLIDDAGQAYQELDNGEGVQNWLGFVRRVRPAESSQGTIIFDVPQKRFKLRVADEEDHFGYINIPLSLGEAPPDLTAPKGPGR